MKLEKDIFRLFPSFNYIVDKKRSGTIQIERSGTIQIERNGKFENFSKEAKSYDRLIIKGYIRKLNNDEKLARYNLRKKYDISMFVWADKNSPSWNMSYHFWRFFSYLKVGLL